MIESIIRSITDRRLGKIERQLAILKQQVDQCYKEQEAINEATRFILDEFAKLCESNEKKLHLIYHDQEIMFDEIKERFISIFNENKSKKP